MEAIFQQFAGNLLSSIALFVAGALYSRYKNRFQKRWIPALVSCAWTAFVAVVEFRDAAAIYHRSGFPMGARFAADIYVVILAVVETAAITGLVVLQAEIEANVNARKIEAHLLTASESFGESAMDMACLTAEQSDRALKVAETAARNSDRAIRIADQAMSLAERVICTFDRDPRMLPIIARYRGQIAAFRAARSAIEADYPPEKAECEVEERTPQVRSQKP